MSNSNGSGGSPVLTLIVIAAVGLVMLSQMFGGSNTSTYTPPAPDKNSFEHRYVTERFKQEGLSKSEAQQAADAVIKFHNAQKNR